MRVEEVMALAGVDRDGRAIEDAWMRGKCPNCGTETRLSDADVEVRLEESTYICPNCSAPFVTVAPAPDPRGGYRLNDWVVNPLGGLQMDLPGQS